MEENLMPVGSAFVSLDLQGSMRMNHNQNPKGLHHTQSHQGSLPLTMGQAYEFEKPNLSADLGKVDRGKASASDEDDPSLNDDGVDGGNYQGKGKRVLLWQRVKWTDSMVRLLITAVSYIGEDVASECSPGGRRKYANLQKKGKWKSVSKVMAERGFCVSPQQCEDKFNDLNKRYKKLNEILGRGTSCQVVENPVLLDVMDHLSEKTKEEVRKILSSKHLFYEEMCSYHNGNRLHLPHDAALQRSLQLALRSRDDHEPGDSQRLPSDEVEEDDHDIESDDQEEEQNMIENVLEFKDTHVREVMTPLVFQLDSLMDLLDSVQRGELQESSTVGDLAHKPVYFIPDSMSVWNLLREFRIRKVHMTIVLNEYGETSSGFICEVFIYIPRTGESIKVVAEKALEEEQTVDAEKDAPAKELEEREIEEKQMTMKTSVREGIG